jgi:cobalt/nickel transport system permease protein
VSRAVPTSAGDVAAALRDFFVADQVAARDGFLQRVHPTGKLLGVLALVGAAVSTDSLLALAALAGFVVTCVPLSRVPPGVLVPRVVVVPAFALVVVLPQLVLLEGRPLVGAFGLTVTDAGLAYVGTFVTRVLVTVSLVSLLVLTTRFSAIVASLRRLGVPAALVTVVAITYRYLVVFFSELHRMLLARESRSLGRGGLSGTWRDLGALSGSFLVRTVERGERVHLAMRARGGDRPANPYRRPHPVGAADVAFVAATAALVGIVALVEVVGWHP